jgi:hypothetical protein
MTSEKCGVKTMPKPRISQPAAPRLHISEYFTLVEHEAAHVIVQMILIWWGCQPMAMHVEFGQRLADQATGALFYALNVRKP